MIGSVVLATDQGLGYLAKDFYDNGIMSRVLIREHSSRTSHEEWYGDNAKPMHANNYDWFFEGLKAVLFFETPFDWKIVLEARKRGVRTVFMPMHECSQYPFPYFFDQVIAPSLLEMEKYPEYNPVFLPVPVSVPWKERKEAKVFVHNAGNGGLGGRNGTAELLAAMRYVKSPIKLVIRSQDRTFSSSDDRVECQKGTIGRADLYATGDVFIFPEKFNGLSLPLQEACASGMLVMATDRHPINTWLPRDPLIPVSRYEKQYISTEFQSAVITPEDIAKTIDHWYGKDIADYSLKGKEWAEENSWQQLKPKYLKVIYGV